MPNNTHITVYDHYTSQPVLASTPVKKRKILCVHIPLLMATSTFGLDRRCLSSPQWLLSPRVSPYHYSAQ